MAMAWMAKDSPRSTCTHCTPFLNSTASSSTGCFFPSVIWRRSPKNGATLLVTGLPAATFTTPAGTWSGGGGLSEGGSMFGPAGRSSGVPLSVWLGSFSFSGSVAFGSSARTDDAKQTTANATAKRDFGKSFSITKVRQPPSVAFPRDSSGNLPAFAIVSLHKLRGLGRVRGAHFGPVPFQLVAHAGSQGDTAKQDDLGEIGSDVEVRISRRASLHHREPFLVG